MTSNSISISKANLSITSPEIHTFCSAKSLLRAEYLWLKSKVLFLSHKPIEALSALFQMFKFKIKDCFSEFNPITYIVEFIVRGCS